MRTRTIPNFRSIHQRLRKAGVETSRLYRSLAINERDVETGEVHITLATYLELLRRAAEQNAMPSLGLQIGRERTVQDLGVVGFMLRNAPTFRHALSIHGNYLDLTIPGATTEIISAGDDAIWTYRLRGFSPEICRQEVEMALVHFLSTARELLNMPFWAPRQVYFQHAKPEYSALLEETFCAPLRFNHYFSGIKMPQFEIDRSINDADPELLRIVEHQVKRAVDDLKDDFSLRGRLTFLISSSLGNVEITAEALAVELGMSRRTLFRRLGEIGTSVAQLRDLVVEQVAKESLCETSVSVAVLAQQLGYSDASAFNRAFKRMTGFAPLKYRQASRAG